MVFPIAMEWPWQVTQEQADMSDKKPHKGDHCPKPDDETPDVTTQGFEGNNPDDSGPTSPPPPPPRKG